MAAMVKVFASSVFEVGKRSALRYARVAANTMLVYCNQYDPVVARTPLAITGGTSGVEDDAPGSPAVPARTNPCDLVGRDAAGRDTTSPRVDRRESEIAVGVSRALAHIGTSISTMTSLHEQFIIDYFGFELRDEPDGPSQFLADKALHDDKLTAACKSNMMWKQSQHENASIPEYIQFLTSVLAHLSPDPHSPYAALPAGRWPTLFSTDRWKPYLPLCLRGTTDVLVGPRAVIDELASMLERNEAADSFGEIFLAIHAKKTTTLGQQYRNWIAQSTGELLAANLKSPTHVLAVLTDFIDDWTFQWIVKEDKRQILYRVRRHTKREALELLARFLSAEPKDLEKGKFAHVEELEVSETFGGELQRPTIATPAAAGEAQSSRLRQRKSRGEAKRGTKEG